MQAVVGRGIVADVSALTARIRSFALALFSAAVEPGEVTFAIVNGPAGFQIAQVKDVMDLLFLRLRFRHQVQGLLHHAGRFQKDQ